LLALVAHSVTDLRPADILGIVNFSCKAILFDLDGVLVDSTPAVARVWGRWATEHSLDPDVVIATAHGRRSIETIRMVAPQMDAAAENVHVERLEIAEREGVTALAGAARMLSALPPDRFAIVTSATRDLAIARLSYAGLPAPQNIVSANAVVHGKPSPEPYLTGAALLGMAPQDCLVFEDTPAGIDAAHAAGMRVVGLITTYSADHLQQANALVASLDEVHVIMDAQILRVAFTPLVAGSRTV
jgi:sugar-phosphatase